MGTAARNGFAPAVAAGRPGTIIVCRIALDRPAITLISIAAANPSVRSFNERAAVNARLQGTAAGIIRRAMVHMEGALAKEKLSAQMLLQVHDELVFELPEDEVAATLPVIKRVMENAPMPAMSLSVPLHVDARAADNWDEAH